MRGIVTLAAALALPTDGVTFPYRDLILFSAFAVVLGTLVVQGMTLRPLITLLHLEEDDTVDREVRLARIETLRAALRATEEASTENGAHVRRHYELQLQRALNDNGDPAETTERAAEDVELMRAAVAAERRRLSALRADGTIGDAAFQRVEQELDWAELDERS
jgi:CPA1 family monovalent cation:H+ antiporter